jgi:hypothetical protein
VEVRANISKKMTFFIVGFGRGGTTILTNALNSLQNGFCLGEPYRYQFDRPDPSGPDWIACGGKVGHLLSGDDPYEAIWGALGDEYLLGGYKETIEPMNDWIEGVMPEHLQLVDFFIVIFRDPVMVHSSQRSLGWNLRPDEPVAYLEDYKFLAELASIYPAVPMVMEDLLQFPLDYLNGRLPFRIQGDFELIPTLHSYGDPAANRATAIRRPDRACSLTSLEIAGHEEARRIWASFRT